MSKNQTVYVKVQSLANEADGSPTFLKSDNFKMKRFLMKLDIKKAFDSVNNIFLIKALDKYGFK